MLAQSENAKAALERAGLKWKKDFRIRTYSIRRNGHFIGYDNATIHLIDMDKAVSLTEKILAEGISAVQYHRHSRIMMYLNNDGKGTLETHEENENV